MDLEEDARKIVGGRRAPAAEPVYIHTHIRTYTLTYTYTCICIHTYTYIHTWHRLMQDRGGSDEEGGGRIYIHTYIYTYIYIHL